jgi:hypothetical protein
MGGRIATASAGRSKKSRRCATLWPEILPNVQVDSDRHDNQDQEHCQQDTFAYIFPKRRFHFSVPWMAQPIQRGRYATKRQLTAA